MTNLVAHSTADAGNQRRLEARAATETILARAAWLGRDDAALLRAVYADGRSAVELGPLVGADPRGLRRRIRRLATRVASPLFLYTTRHHTSWPKGRRDVAAACILRGRSIRQAARELGIPIYTVRRHMDVIRGMYETAIART